tara:strand:+ start:295 stop:825 length:531 start_codon:yes stop_codon:yes gene_type:complete
MLDKIRRLIELSAGEFEHIDMQLMAHLDGTRCLLKAWGAREELQQAGLFHQAYSKGLVKEKQYYNQAQRALIAAVIGEQSEVIVYHYCACDRDVFFSSLIRNNTPDYVDRFLASAQSIEEQLLKDLCEMFVATELELALNDPRKNLLHDAQFRTFLTKLAPYLSRGANNKISQLLV